MKVQHRPLSATPLAVVQSPQRTKWRLRVEFEYEDNKWLADIPEMPGVMAFGATKEEALNAVKALAFQVAADQLLHGEPIPGALLDAFEE